MFALAGLVILHASVAASLVEVLLRLWRVQDPAERAGLRWLALVAPLAAVAAFAAAAPFRSSEAFATDWALFAGRHWNQITIAGEGLAAVATAALTVVGALLYLRDALPFLGDRVGRDLDQDISSDPQALGRVDAALAAVGGGTATPVRPRIVFLASQTSVLLCKGVAQPVIVVSAGTLARLGDGELRAALAHELAHARAHDPLLGWLLMAIRTCAWFSPATQIVARQIVQELEHRADLAAVRAAGSEPLGRAIEALSDVPDADTDLREPGRPFSRASRLLARAQRAAVGTRCDRVFSQIDPPRSDVAGLRLVLASAGLAALLFFIV